ncbi:MAG TPA: SPOR domain-containing protein [Pseudolabrys sp.]|nr:SPOR domain-containing protein [Pseudolabrys sp.]
MADNYNQRSNRPNDPYARPAEQPAAASNDPLAELARLIGQTDPFGEFGRDARRAAAPPQAPAPARKAAADPADWGDAPLSAPLVAEPRQPATPAGYAAQPVFAPSAAPQVQTRGMPSFSAPSFEHVVEPHGQGEGYEAGYDQAGYAEPQHDAAGDDGDAYYQHGSGEGQDIYDDVPPRRRRRIVAIASVSALIILGVAGAWGYRSMFGPSGSKAPPPVIKADTTPSKVVPPQSADNSASKQIYDRIGDSQGDKVVSREETPVDVKPTAPPPRVVFPAAGNGQPSVVAPPGPGPVAINPTGNEPKKIRTIVIRPDQPVLQEAGMPVVARPSAPTPPPPPPTRTAAVAPAAVSDAPNAAAPPPAPAARPAPVRPAAAPVQQAAADPNAPLSLSPGAKPRTPPARLASNPPAAAAAPAASGGGPGHYVQVSSQRSEAEAQSAYRSLAAKYPNVLGNRALVIRKAEIAGKGTYYRATVGPFGSSEEASQLCSELKAAGGACIVQRN